MGTGSLTGRTIGNYLLGPLIGRGGMGEVYEGTHRFLGTAVAVKTLRGGYAGDQGIANRFFLEAKAAVEIAHPNIVRVLDFGQGEDEILYLVMERLQGCSLGEDLRQGPLATGSAALVGLKVAEALEAAHQRGIVHRDLKPDNIFLSTDGVKVLDFGIAKAINQVAATSQSALLGTPLYMAPEQSRGTQHTGTCSDIYSLGAILFEMLTGRPPFLGQDIAQIITAHLMDAPPTLRELDPGIDPRLEQLVLACLEKDPAGRPSSMAALAARLRTFVPEGATEPGPRGEISSGRPPAANEHAVQAFVPTDSWSRAHSPPLIGAVSSLSGAAAELGATASSSTARVSVGRAAALLALLVAAGGAAVWWRASGEQRPAPVPTTRPAPAPAGPRPPPPVALPTAPPRRPAAAAPAPAPIRVVVRSEPASARVTVAGQDRGHTPTVLSLVPPQAIELSRRGYRPLREVITGAGEVLLKLERLPSRKPARVVPAPAAGPPHEGLD